MKKISQKRVKQLAKQKGLVPAVVDGTTNRVVLTKGGGDKRLDVISWPQFFDTLKSKGLVVKENNGFMKIMYNR